MLNFSYVGSQAHHLLVVYSVSRPFGAAAQAGFSVRYWGAWILSGDPGVLPGVRAGWRDPGARPNRDTRRRSQ